MPDVRKDLEDLRDEWLDCTGCSLGIRREEVQGEFVFGEGDRRGILFVGEGPGKEEERKGLPFVGRSGQVVLHPVIEHLKIDRYYITNIVACRSCAQLTDATGVPIFGYEDKEKVPLWKDEPPTKTQMDACLPRLHEQIYLIDPVVIVSLGAKAAEALTGKHISITKERGVPREVPIPGHWRVPARTATRKAWIRKTKGQLYFPTAQNTIRYFLIPTFHPAYVLRKSSDKGPRSPTKLFGEDINTAKNVYEFLQKELNKNEY